MTTSANPAEPSRQIEVRGGQGMQLGSGNAQVNEFNPTYIARLEYWAPGVTGRAVSLPPRPTMLAGREDLLAGLHTRMSVGDGASPSIVALHGLAGAGKTSIATEYAYRQLVSTGVVWLFPAEEPTVLAAEFGRLAAQLGVGGLLEARDPVASVHGVMAASDAPWLLIFDNAPDQESVWAFLPPAGNGQVLITSQNALWPVGQAMEVPVLGIEAAAGFLTARTSDPDEEVAAKLARELDGLPLALEQAGAYICASGSSLGGYLAEFRQRRRDLLARGEPTGYGKTIATTWSLAFERLESTSPSAVGLLRLLACLAPEPVPLLLLLQLRDGSNGGFGPDVSPTLTPLQGDSLAIGDAVAALRRYSLVTVVGDGLVLMHRLVQAVTLDHLPADHAAQWREAATVLIETAIPADTSPPESWQVCTALLAHAQTALANASDGMQRIANYLDRSGSYSAARDLQQRIADAYTRALGTDHPITIRTRVNLASMIAEAGDPAAARDQLADLLPTVERIFGPEHPNTLTTRNNLALWTEEAGDPGAARDQLAALLSIRKRARGAEHPDTLATRHNLATCTGEAGDSASARDQLAALLPVEERIRGAENPMTLTTRHNLAFWTGIAGDPAGARDQYATLLPIVEHVYGAEHPETLTTRANLASWIGKAGDSVTARDRYTVLIPVEERIWGAEHPATLAGRANLAWYTGEAGDPAGARDQYAALLPIAGRVHGAEHPDTLAFRTDLARWTGEAGNPASARDQLAALLPAQERVSGAGHPNTLRTRVGLARWTGEAGDPSVAHDQYAALLPVLEQVLGPKHPETMAARADLARWTKAADGSAHTRIEHNAAGN